MDLITSLEKAWNTLPYSDICIIKFDELSDLPDGITTAQLFYHEPTALDIPKELQDGIIKKFGKLVVLTDEFEEERIFVLKNRWRSWIFKVSLYVPGTKIILIQNEFENPLTEWPPAIH